MRQGGAGGAPDPQIGLAARSRNQKKKLRKYKGRLGREASSSAASEAGSHLSSREVVGGGAWGPRAAGASKAAAPAPRSVDSGSAQASHSTQEQECAEAVSRGDAGARPHQDLSAAALCLAQRLGQRQGQEQQQEQEGAGEMAGQGARPKARRVLAAWGNYHRYYGKRLVEGQAEDPRLQALEEAWFRGRRCLDVGCNEGLLTLQLVRKFAPASMTGVDLDPYLIHEAARQLRGMRQAVTQELLHGEGPKAALRRAVAALAQTTFVQGDCLGQAAPQPASLDAILCLSVTKWLHLAKGDAGLEAFFACCSAALAPGGLLVLEPQPWKSYVSAHKRPGAATAGYAALASLRLRPERFVACLTTRHGFRLARELTPPQSLPGFARPLYLLEKAGS